MMTPNSDLYGLRVSIEPTSPNDTYRLQDKKIQGNISDMEAIKQSIYKILSTERYDYPIYGFNYGIEFSRLIGQDMTYVKVEMKRLIKEALLRDDRILDTVNFIFSFEGDEVLCTFDAITIYGTFSVRKEVTI